MIEITKITLLSDAFNGIDVRSLFIAQKFRELQKEHPDLIAITAPAHHYSVSESRPYFGVITTKQGEDFLRQLAWCKVFDLPKHRCDCPDCGTTLVDYSG